MNFASAYHHSLIIGGLLLSVSLILAGCGGGNGSLSPAAATPTPTIAPTITPTVAHTLTPAPTLAPTPAPTPVAPPPDDQLIAACAAGTPIPGAAPYGGTLHPLLVVWSASGEWQVDDLADVPPTIYDVDNKWLDGSWPGPIQLVACVDQGSSVKVDSCGTYVRQSDGMTGEVIRYKGAQTVRILVAATGKLLQSQTYYGALPNCPTSFQDVDDPPWPAWGDEPDDMALINAYVTAVSTQKVK